MQNNTHNIPNRQYIDAISASKQLMAYWQEVGVFVPEIDYAKPEVVTNTPKKTTPPPRQMPVFTKPIDGQQLAIELAKDAKTLAELKQVLKDFDGCNLKKNATQMVFADGVETADIMLIGEAPGFEEDQQGKPFVGNAGKLLDVMLSSIGLSRNENIYITNMVNWRPPANRTPTRDEIAICLPFAQRHIFLKRPKILVLVGGVAASAILGTSDGITKLRRKTHEVKIEGLDEPIPTFCLLHPAFLLRQPSQKSLAWKDLLTIEAQIKQTGI